MSIHEFYRWADYIAEEPLLVDRIELLGGVIASTIANANRGKSTRPFTFMDFMPIASAQQKKAVDALDDEQFARMQMLKFRTVVGGKGKM